MAFDFCGGNKIAFQRSIQNSTQKNENEKKKHKSLMKETHLQ